MLLKFSVKNYKSFKDEMIFSMEPAAKQKDLNYSVLSQKAGKKAYKGLCSAVIYGANASGKTNIIGAMEVFKHIILTGNINNHNVNTPNIAVNRLELIPNSFILKKEPVEFYIKFIENNLLIEYKLRADLGSFLNDEYERKILYEQLRINETNIFERSGDEILVENLLSVEDYLANSSILNSQEMEKAAKSNVNEKELYLVNNFKAFYSNKIPAIITDWFNRKFLVFLKADCLQAVPKLEIGKGKAVIDDLLNKAAREFGISSNLLIYTESKEKPELVLNSYFEKKGKKVSIPADYYESYGTLRFVDIFPILAIALAQGATLAIDELDASIHPMAIMNIVNIFHNDEINKKHAQLIFNTHNPIFLDRNLFRRDEIKFVERDDNTHYSTHYSLSDFGTAGKDGVRKTGDYMKNYFVSRYGAIRDVDFSDLFLDIVENKQKEATKIESQKNKL